MTMRVTIVATIVACVAVCACRASTATLSDPLALDRDLAELEQVAVRVRVAEIANARPEGRNLLIGPWTPDSEGAFLARVIERRERWVRLASDELAMRLALWVPESQVEIVAPDSVESWTLNLSPLPSDAGWVEVERGTRLLDEPNGAAFGVMLRDGALHWCGGRSEDGFVEVCLSTNWGYLRAYIRCPCKTVRGAGG